MEKQSGEVSNALQDRVITEQVVEAKAERFERTITSHCNEKFKSKGALISTLVIMRIMQNVTLNVAKQLHGTDKTKGREYVETCYNVALKDALTEWDSKVDA